MLSCLYTRPKDM